MTSMFRCAFVLLVIACDGEVSPGVDAGPRTDAGGRGDDAAIDPHDASFDASEDAPAFACGDGETDLDEECDDGNGSCLDGCTNECRVESACDVIDLMAEAHAEPSGGWRWHGPLAYELPTDPPLICRGNRLQTIRWFRFEAPAEGLLELGDGAHWSNDPGFVVGGWCDGAMFCAGSRQRLAAGEVLQLGVGGLGPFGGIGSVHETLRARFRPRRALGAACDPDSVRDWCGDDAWCGDDGVGSFACAPLRTDSSCGALVGVVDVELPAPGEILTLRGRVPDLASRIGASWPCVSSERSEIVYRLSSPRDVAIAIDSPTAEIHLGIAHGSCRPPGGPDCLAAPASSATGGIVLSGEETFLVVETERASSFEIAITAHPVAGLGEPCDPRSALACSGGAVCVSGLCASGGDAGCGAGVRVTELREHADGTFRTDQVLNEENSLPLPSCLGELALVPGRFAVPYRFVAPSDGILRVLDTTRYFWMSRDVCNSDAPLFCGGGPVDVGPVRAGDTLYFFVLDEVSFISPTDKLVLAIERPLPGGAACDPRSALARCAPSSACAGPIGATTCGSGDAGCGAGIAVSELGDEPSVRFYGDTSLEVHRRTPACGTGSAPEALHRWRAPFRARVELSAEAAFATVLSIGGSCAALDAGCGDERITVEVDEGDTLFVAVDGSGSGAGLYTLSIDAEPLAAEGEPCEGRACPGTQVCRVAADGTSGCAEPRCGDDWLDDGEACDDGDTLPSGPCTVDCHHSIEPLCE